MPQPSPPRPIAPLPPQRRPPAPYPPRPAGPPPRTWCWCPALPRRRRDRHRAGRGPAEVARPDRQQDHRRGRCGRHQRGRRVVLRRRRDGAGRRARLGGQHDRDDDLPALPGPHPRHGQGADQLPAGGPSTWRARSRCRPPVAAGGETGRARVSGRPPGRRPADGVLSPVAARAAAPALGGAHRAHRRRVPHRAARGDRGRAAQGIDADPGRDRHVGRPRGRSGARSGGDDRVDRDGTEPRPPRRPEPTGTTATPTPEPTAEGRRRARSPRSRPVTTGVVPPAPPTSRRAAPRTTGPNSTRRRRSPRRPPRTPTRTDPAGTETGSGARQRIGWPPVTAIRAPET